MLFVLRVLNLGQENADVRPISPAGSEHTHQFHQRLPDVFGTRVCE